MIVNEADGTNPRDARWLCTIDGLRIYNKEQLIDFLTEAGFSSITVDHSPNMHRLCCWQCGGQPPYNLRKAKISVETYRFQRLFDGAGNRT